MIREELVFVATCDISGHVRGKGFPARELPGRLKKGIGWTGSNLMMSPAGPIWDTPFGTAGDLMIVPDPAAEVRVDFADGSAIEHFFLGDICTTDGKPWECCPRDFLRRAVHELEDAAGLHLVAAFEQEFLYTGIEDRPGDAYALGAFRRQGSFGETFIAALRAAGPVPDSFLAEYGPRSSRSQWRRSRRGLPPTTRSSPARWRAPRHTVSAIARSFRQNRCPTMSAAASTSI